MISESPTQAQPSPSTLITSGPSTSSSSDLGHPTVCHIILNLEIKKTGRDSQTFSFNNFYVENFSKQAGLPLNYIIDSLKLNYQIRLHDHDEIFVYNFSNNSYIFSGYVKSLPDDSLIPTSALLTCSEGPSKVQHLPKAALKIKSKVSTENCGALS
mmetsp:Transcript_24628/g.21800  ORF Transcript_24628/g.21800 Transcript_24628/m.21800 type:complete len:156 (+) Transcript_24628:95-562(+)